MNRLQFWQYKLAQLTGEGPQGPRALATGADRPALGAACAVDWSEAPLMTHPLQPRVSLRVPASLDVHRVLDSSILRGEVTSDALQSTALRLWRGLRDEDTNPGLLGDLVPADSRCPDHARYNHVRIAAAACFVAEVDGPACREPCMVRLSLHGVQDFIAESRKTRDLWTACMIYGELVWAAMEPIVERYGPEAILYPDLLGNPFMDQWLLRRGGEAAEAVPRHIRDAGAPTAAVPVPNTFVALLPRGAEGEDFLVPVETLMGDCRERIASRWRTLAAASRGWLESRAGKGRWSQIYQRQLLDPPDLSWTAVAWPRSSAPQAFEPWIEADIRAAYERLRVLSGDDASAGRGFDYPLVHRQLCRIHEGTGLARRPPVVEEPGEKCTLTGRHEVLNDDPAGLRRDLHDQRRAARAFWKVLGRDESGHISDRLGGPAAFKRYLARAAEGGLVERWNGVKQTPPTGRDLTAPFPSTAGLAAGPSLEGVAERWSELRTAGRAVLAALDKTRLPPDTQHRHSLPRLRRWTAPGGDPDLCRFLCMEAQYLSPAVLQAHHDRAEDADKANIVQMMSAVSRFRQRLRELEIAEPGEQVAILAMDGDSLSKLVLGDPKVIRARWADVLHPQARGAESWKDLLSQPRAMGPSLHAAITRALADFTDTIAPWVIEVEFSGRLVYAGGDDVLAMLPANEVVPAAARLQQLYSAPWVVDTAPRTPPWAGRRGLTGDGRGQIRFWVPRAADGEIAPLSGPFEPTVGRAASEPAPPEGLQLEGVRVFPMLGRAHTLSGGAALGHFKTPLQALILAARENLEVRAKGRTKRCPRGKPQGHLSVSRFTSSGSKSTFTAPWGLGGADTQSGPPVLAETFRTLVGAFGGPTPSLSARLPYALREIAELLLPILQEPGLRPEKRDVLLRGMAREAGEHADLVGAILQTGLEESAHDMVAGLLLARHLAGGQADDR